MQTICLNDMYAALRRSAALLVSALVLTLGVPEAEAQGKGLGKKISNVSLIPTITEIALNDAGELVASGTAAVTNKGKTTTVPFSDVPVNLSIADDQTGAGECPILDLELGPIDLNLLGLIVETSPICLRINAEEGGGLLGDLLCAVSNLLDGGLDLGDILDGVGLPGVPALTGVQATSLLPGLEDLLNEALGSLEDAVLENIEERRGRVCAILNLELGPVDLNLLGLDVELDDCEGGPVTVDITARRGQLLGNVLCGLLHPKRGGGIDLGDLLGDILGDLLGEALP